MNTPPTHSSQSSVRRVRRLLITSAILLPILLIAAVAWVIWFGPQRRINAELARIRAASEPVTPDELDAFYAYPPGDEDATQLWLDAIAPLDTPAFQTASAQLPFFGENQEPPLPGEPWPNIAAAEAFLATQSEVLNSLHKAAEMGAARYPLNFRAGINMLILHATQIRAAGALLRLEARVRAHHGDVAGAARSVRALAAAGRSIEREPILVSQLVCLAVHGMAYDELRVLMPTVAFPSAELARLQVDLQSVDFKTALYAAMVGERVIGQITFNNPSSLTSTPSDDLAKTAFLRIWLRSDLSFFLRSMDQIISATKKPWPEALDIADRAMVKVRAARGIRHIFTSLLTPALDAGFRAAARVTARARSTDAAIAVELFRRRHDRLPESLEELVPNFLAQVPDDPFSGDPLKYKVEPDGYVVYSVGPDKIDDGGKEDETHRRRGPDFVFRVAAPVSK